MNDCAICHENVAANANTTPIGNSVFHTDCLNRKRKEAEGKGATLHFIWRNDSCTEVRMVFEQSVTSRSI